MTKFSENLTNLLEQKGLKRADIINTLNLPEGTVRSWFSRDCLPSVETGYKVAQYLGVTVEYLLTGEEGERAKQKTATSLSDAISDILNSNENSKLNFDTRIKIAKHLENALSCLLTGEDKTEEPKKSEIESLYEELSEENQKEVLNYTRYRLSQQPKEASKAI